MDIEELKLFDIYEDEVGLEDHINEVKVKALAELYNISREEVLFLVSFEELMADPQFKEDFKRVQEEIK